MFLPLLEMIQGQCDGFVSSQPTREQGSMILLAVRGRG
jgi:hypothetical protein